MSVEPKAILRALADAAIAAADPNTRVPAVLPPAPERALSLIHI